MMNKGKTSNNIQKQKNKDRVKEEIKQKINFVNRNCNEFKKDRADMTHELDRKRFWNQQRKAKC